MLLILPHINGVNSVKQIALLADADYKLVRKAIAHLLYYGCVMLLDIFSFAASYAPTAEIGSFIGNEEVQEECRRYVLVSNTGLLQARDGNQGGTEVEREALDGIRLVELYCSLRQGQSVRSWCLEYVGIVGSIDVRRFITFGVIKGFLYRVHKYAITTGPTGPLNKVDGKEGQRIGRKELERYLDGNHCFDQICTELLINERELLSRLKEIGDVQIVQR